MPRKKRVTQVPAPSPVSEDRSSPLALELEGSGAKEASASPSPPASPCSPALFSPAKMKEASPFSPKPASPKALTSSGPSGPPSSVKESAPALSSGYEKSPARPDPTSSNKVRSMDEITGIPPLHFEKPEATGKSSWSTVVKSAKDDLAFPDLDNVEYSAAGKVKITLDDIAEELDYWTSSVVCHVLGANPPVQIILAFLKRIWSDLGIDKVSGLGKGYYIVKFVNLEDRNAALEKGTAFFDRKPMIVRPGSADFNINSVDEIKVPVWTRFPGLPLKYWGRNTLSKIASDLGRPLRMDRATASKERLSYARILIEMNIQKVFPLVAQFENEIGIHTEVPVSYEWSPVKCSHCSLFGHSIETCKKLENEKKKCDYCNLTGHTKEECRRKGKQPAKPTGKQPVQKAASKPDKPKDASLKNKQDSVIISNRFAPMHEIQEEEDMQGHAVSQRKEVPPLDMPNFPPLSING